MPVEKDFDPAVKDFLRCVAIDDAGHGALLQLFVDHKAVDSAGDAAGTQQCHEKRPLGIALAKAVSEGHRDFVRIVIAGRSEGLCVPCGVCRQVLREFAPNIEIICLNGAGEERTFTLEELLPHSFGPEYLQ